MPATLLSWIRNILRPATLGGALIYGFAPALGQYAPSPSFGLGQSVDQPSRQYTGLPFAGWMFYPSLLVGAVFDSNVNQTPMAASASGARLVPNLTAQRDDGIYKATLYGNMDGRFYVDGDQTSQIDARAGVSEVYEARRDLVFTFQGDYSRQTNVFTNANTNPPATVSASLSEIAPISTTTINPSNQFSGLASVQKTLDHGFLGLSASIADVAYDNTGSLDSTTYAVAGRAGYLVTPQLYAYVEPTLDWQQYASSLSNSYGYRIVSGLGSDQLGLLHGEVYGGYQAEIYDVGPTSVGNVFGCKLTYLPTLYWTFSGIVDRNLGVAQTNPTATTLNPALTTSAILQSDYAISRLWSASARFGYLRVEYVNFPRVDDDWLAGAQLKYSVWLNMMLTLEYQYTSATSDIPGVAYIRHLATVGITYKY
jgi:hypothetical protein